MTDRNGGDRVRYVSTVLMNFGTGLTATAIAKWYLAGFDAFILTWLFLSAALIWSGWQVLTMLDAEENDE